jgi:antitoxin CptB
VPEGTEPDGRHRQDQGTDGAAGGVNDDEPIGERELSKLRWRCRRGLLENDLFIERFFERHAGQLTTRQASALSDLMELADNDLLDLLLQRKEPEGKLDTTDVKEVLAMLRTR